MKKYIIPIVMLLAVGATSCDDALDLEPQDRITDKDYFNTENDLMLFSAEDHSALSRRPRAAVDGSGPTCDVSTHFWRMSTSATILQP